MSDVVGPPSLWRRFLTSSLAGLGVSILLPGLLATWGTLSWLMSGVFVRRVRVTPLEWAVFLVLSWGLLIAMCALLGRLTAFAIEAFSNERRRACLRVGLGVVAGAIAGAFATGALTMSLATGQPGVPDTIPSYYWLCGPGLAVTSGIGWLLLERKHEA